MPISGILTAGCLSRPTDAGMQAVIDRLSDCGQSITLPCSPDALDSFAENGICNI